MRRSFLDLGLVVVALAAVQTSAGQAIAPSQPNAQCTGSKQHTKTLYVATANQINVYSLGATAPRLIITDGLAGVTQIAIDMQGMVYASNFGAPITFADTGVTEYQPGTTSPTITRTNGAFSATGVAVDAKGNVFASSYYRNTVSEYRPGEVDPFLVLTQGISGPGLLAVNRSRAGSTAHPQGLPSLLDPPLPHDHPGSYRHREFSSASVLKRCVAEAVWSEIAWQSLFTKYSDSSETCAATSGARVLEVGKDEVGKRVRVRLRSGIEAQMRVDPVDVAVGADT